VAAGAGVALPALDHPGNARVCIRQRLAGGSNPGIQALVTFVVGGGTDEPFTDSGAGFNLLLEQHLGEG
jgi:hypothetical protein